jgi:hypothetical protein
LPAMCSGYFVARPWAFVFNRQSSATGQITKQYRNGNAFVMCTSHILANEDDASAISFRQ